MKVVDILLATYNGEKYVEEQINSILKQSYKEIRLIISDDNSTDNTLKIIEKLQKSDSRIIVYKQNKNLGVTANFEFLLNKVENDYFMFADQDDIWLEDKVKKSVEKLENDKCDLVFTNLKIVDENLKVLNKSFWKAKGLNQKIKKHMNFEGLYLNNFVTGCTTICKKKFIKQILPLPKNTEYILYDYWLALVVSKNGKIGKIEEPQILYRQHKHNAVGAKRKSDLLNSFDEVRNLFIDVKIDHFKVFVEREKLFSNDLKIQNEKALKYYRSLKDTKNINFRNWGLFIKLYKCEGFIYSLLNFVILNIPGLGRGLYKLKSKIGGKHG